MQGPFTFSVRCLDLISWEWKVATSINASHSWRGDLGQRRTLSERHHLGRMGRQQPVCLPGFCGETEPTGCADTGICFKGLPCECGGWLIHVCRAGRLWAREGLTVWLQSKESPRLKTLLLQGPQSFLLTSSTDWRRLTHILKDHRLDSRSTNLIVHLISKYLHSNIQTGT